MTNSAKGERSFRVPPTLFESTSDCCGCAACENTCSKNAIEMVADDEGFEFPVINEELCVSCGACVRACGFQRVEFSETRGMTYAAIGANVNIMRSASGGIFAQVAADTLSEGGAICACSLVFDEKGESSVLHTIAEDADGVAAMVGSKYVQSKMGSAMRRVRKLLNEGREVVFCGTPCQVAGLRRFLGGERANLLTVDLVCHGVPSHKLFSGYIDHLRRGQVGIPTSFTFRSKRKGWENFTLILHLRNSLADGSCHEEEVCIPAFESSYFDLFLQLVTLRESCYGCPFAGRVRPGDITIGDFWGIEQAHPEILKVNGGPLDPAKGISCIIANTARGQEWLSAHSESFVLCESSFEEVAKGNDQLRKPSARGGKRDRIYKVFNKGGYASVERMWIPRRIAKSIRRMVGRLVPKSLKTTIKMALCRVRPS